VEKRYSPGHPVSDEDGYIYLSNVNLTNEMVDMLEAKHQYQNSVEVLNTVRSLMMRTLKLGS
jgi:flagellar basal-body rod protein FlgC